MAANRQIEIKVIAKQCKTREGKTFTAYNAVQKDGKLIDCRFRKCVQNIPESDFVMLVNSTEINIARNYEYPRLWVSAVLEFKPINGSAAEAADEDLPF